MIDIDVDILCVTCVFIVVVDCAVYLRAGCCVVLITAVTGAFARPTDARNGTTQPTTATGDIRARRQSPSESSVWCTQTCDSSERVKLTIKLLDATARNLYGSIGHLTSLNISQLRVSKHLTCV